MPLDHGGMPPDGGMTPPDGGMMLLDDRQISARLGPRAAVAAMRQAITDAERGILAAPARVTSDLGDGRLVFTTGARAGQWFGYRSYDTFGAEPGAQVVVVHDRHTGLVKAVAVGHELGRCRTGAIGGVAADVLARPDAAELAMIGTGPQAWAQLWAISSVRDLTGVRVWSRDACHRESFAHRAETELGLRASPARGAQDAVYAAGIVVLATSSPVPVLDPSWLADGCHVTSLGPKQQGRAEFGAALAARADVLVTDSLAQAHGYQPPFVLDGTPQMDRLVSLGSVIEGAAPGRTGPGQVTLFCSVGLAGTEVHLLASLTGQKMG
jgi:ornithine cyclodeaminase/alanine dehydrogenase-like protein (mu-crystallin family)